MAQVLQLTFANDLGKKMTFNVHNPKAELTEAEVNAAMQTIIEQEVFTNEGFPYNVKHSAKIVDREVTEFEIIG